MYSNIYLLLNSPDRISPWGLLSKINEVVKEQLKTIDGLSDDERRKLWEDHIWETL